VCRYDCILNNSWEHCNPPPQSRLQPPGGSQPHSVRHYGVHHLFWVRYEILMVVNMKIIFVFVSFIILYLSILLHVLEFCIQVLHLSCNVLSQSKFISDEVLWSSRPYKLWLWQHVAWETENLNTEFVFFVCTSVRKCSKFDKFSCSYTHVSMVEYLSWIKGVLQEIEPGLFYSQICFVGRQFGITNDVPAAIMTGGLVQEYKHIILPEVTPRTTFLCTLLSVLVSNYVLSSYLFSSCTSWGK
jgi:hypothetical protein